MKPGDDEELWGVIVIAVAVIFCVIAIGLAFWL